MSVDMLLLDSNVTSSQQTLTFSRPYITGELTAVKSHVNDRPKDKIRVMATIKIDSDVSLTLSVCSHYQVVAFHKNLKALGWIHEFLLQQTIISRLWEEDFSKCHIRNSL